MAELIQCVINSNVINVTMSEMSLGKLMNAEAQHTPEESQNSIEIHEQDMQ